MWKRKRKYFMNNTDHVHLSKQNRWRKKKNIFCSKSLIGSRNWSVSIKWLPWRKMYHIYYIHTHTHTHTHTFFCVCVFSMLTKQTTTTKTRIFSLPCWKASIIFFFFLATRNKNLWRIRLFLISSEFHFPFCSCVLHSHTHRNRHTNGRCIHTCTRKTPKIRVISFS